jgi:hypothetical protein
MALDMPVIDQPVSREMGRRKTGSENMASIATQPKMPPAAQSSAAAIVRSKCNVALRKPLTALQIYS